MLFELNKLNAMIDGMVKIVHISVLETVETTPSVIMWLVSVTRDVLQDGQKLCVKKVLIPYPFHLYYINKVKIFLVIVHIHFWWLKVYIDNLILIVTRYLMG